jgi:hypothetical protein
LRKPLLEVQPADAPCPEFVQVFALHLTVNQLEVAALENINQGDQGYF